VDPKHHARVLMESAHCGLEMRLMAQLEKERAEAGGKCMTLDSVADAKVAADGKPQNKKEAKLLTALKKRGVDVSALSRADIDKLVQSRRPKPEKAIPRPGPNEPCPCGRTDDTGKRLKFKRCCGSVTGDLHYFVADSESNEALSNDDGRVLIFHDHTTAAAAAKAKGWVHQGKHIEIIPLNPEKWADFKSKLPYVVVTTKEFNVGEKVEVQEDAPPDPGMGTMVHHEPCPDCSGEPCPHVTEEHPELHTSTFKTGDMPGDSGRRYT
jgi:hypothetical protein